MNATLFTNGLFLDVEAASYREGDLRVEDGMVAETGSRLDAPTDARRVDLDGAYVLPGLIDSHVHIMASTADMAELARWPVSYNAHRTSRLLGEMLDRGFTTVRDMAGADYGTWRALEEGLIRGPRLFYAGRALSQTGGHGDHRGPGEHLLDTHPGTCDLSTVVDGVAEVRRAARDELRRGAHHIKVMAGGGVASPTDRIDSTQFSVAELEAAVEEAKAANRYVAAHAYTPDSIARALGAGVPYHRARQPSRRRNRQALRGDSGLPGHEPGDLLGIANRGPRVSACRKRRSARSARCSTADCTH